MASSKIGNEIKIGVMVVVAILMFIIGLNFLKGNNLFSSDLEFYTYYDNVQGLQNSATVQLNGLNIGKVTNIELQPDKKIRVDFNINKGINIPEGSIAKLTSNDFISGTKVISMLMSENETFIEDGSYVTSQESEGILDDISESVSPLVATVRNTLTSLDTVLNSVNSLINEQTRHHLNASFASLEVTMEELAALSKVLNAQSQNLGGVIKNANSITSNLASNNEKLNTTFSNLESFSNQLNQAEIDKTLKDLQNAAHSFERISAKINENEGTLGMILNDKELYHSLNRTLNAMDTLMTDLKRNPSKYINVSVFGSK